MFLKQLDFNIVFFTISFRKASGPNVFKTTGANIFQTGRGRPRVFLGTYLHGRRAAISLSTMLKP